MLTQDEIAAWFKDASEKSFVKLPESLWDGGSKPFTEAVDRIRSIQETASSRQMFLIQELSNVDRILEFGKKHFEMNRTWPDKIPTRHKLVNYRRDLRALLDVYRLLHGDMNRARSDLRSKIMLLEAEARMGPSGTIRDKAITGFKEEIDVSEKKVDEDKKVTFDPPPNNVEDIDWDSLT